MKTLVIVPAYNEEENIAGVIRDLRQNFPVADIVVIDDGSRDKTCRIAEATGAKVIKLPFNLGIGGAVQTGYIYAFQKDYDIAIQFDGDGQHIAAEIEKIYRPIIEDMADIAIGSRFKEGNYKSPLLRRVGILFFSHFISCVTGMKTTDPTSGFRAGNRKAIELFSRTYPEDYPEAESLVLAKDAGLRIIEVSAKMQRRRAGRSSITAFSSVYYMIKVSLAILIDLIKRRP